MFKAKCFYLEKNEEIMDYTINARRNEVENNELD